MAVQTSAGSKLYIGTTASNPVGDSYVEVGDVVSIPAFGRSYNEITYTPLATRAVQKFKGSYNDGTTEVTLGRNPADTGQAAMIAALASDHDYNFKLTLNDASTVSGATPTTFTFKAKVMSFATDIGDVGQVVGATASLGIKSGSITETAAT